jgi:hypothetical protein
MPFKKNDININRNGRPPKELAITDLLRSESLEIDPDTGKPKREAMVRVIYDKALKGERWACEFIVDRTEGKPIQATIIADREFDEVVEI